MTAETGPDTPQSGSIRGRASTLEVEVFGVRFQNPVLLAAGTCGFGEELRDVVDLEALGGLVTKSVTREPRSGNAAPRLTELAGAMLNSVGLANPGVEAVCGEKLPWLRRHVRRARVVVSVAGHTVEEFGQLVERLDDAEGFDAFELNLSCPNDDRLPGATFAHSAAATAAAIVSVRKRTRRPVIAKLAPVIPTLEETIRAATEAGADAITLINTLPGLALDPDTGRPALGAGSGGMSGPVLMAAGLHAVSLAREATALPLIGVGGISSAEDARDYLRAGASLVQIGTATFADPRTAERVIRGLERWARSGEVPPRTARRGRPGAEPIAPAATPEVAEPAREEAAWPR